MTILILTLIGIFFFTVYNIVILYKFGVPVSLSDSFYLLNGIKKGLGFLFTAMMVSMAFCLMPGWLEITETITSWSSNFTALPFLAAAGIAFVGAAPAFRKNEVEKLVHGISAYLAAAFAILWICIVCYEVALIVLPISVFVIVVLGLSTKTLKSSKIYWLEMLAFLATFATILIEVL
jgi:hypothetical protein